MASAASTTFVQELYQTILLRSGSAADVNSWATLLDSGLLTQSQETSAFETSGEAVAYTDLVVRMYETFFGRAPDPSGLSGWVNALRQGTITAQGLAEGFVGSQEFQNRFGQSPNFTAFVTALYQNVLGRAPDAPGLAAWVNALATGALDYAGVALGFCNSPEFIANATGAINTWLTASVTNAENGITPPYPDQGVAIPGIIPTGTSTEYVLTTGIDNATATQFFASETYFTTDGKGPTLNPGDDLTGAGSNNTLTITDLTAGVATDNLPQGVILNNIQNVVLNSSGNTAASGFSTVGFAGVKTLTVTTAGVFNDVIAAANGTTGGTDVTATHSAFAGGGLSVIGGNNVTVTGNGLGGLILVGLTAPGSVPAPSSVATGAISVTDNDTFNGTFAGGSYTGGGVFIVGGTNVTVKGTSSSWGGSINIGNTSINTGLSPAGGIANPTGAITVTDNSIGHVGNLGGNFGSNTGITIMGGTTVTVTTAGSSKFIAIGDSGVVAASDEPTGAVTVTAMAQHAFDGIPGPGHNNVRGGNIAINGGTDVTVTANSGGSINVGTHAISQAAVETGKVTVTQTGLSVSSSYSGVFVDGGTDVTIATAGGSVVVGHGNGAVITNPTGAISITETAPVTFSNHNSITANGGTTVNVTALGQSVAIGAKGAPTGAVVVSQKAVLTGFGAGSSGGHVTVQGGTSVTVTTTGGGVTVGGSAGFATGAVSITDTFSGANAASSEGFFVLSGTTVNITTTPAPGFIGVGPTGNLLNATGTALSAGLIAPSGNVTIVNDEVNSGVTTYGTGYTFVTTNGATTVSITGGSVGFIGDAEATLATGGSSAGAPVGTSTLAAVVLDGDQINGVTAVNSGALSSLTLLDTPNASALNLHVNDPTPGTTLSLIVGNLSKAGDTLTDVAGTIATLNVSDNGKVNAATGSNKLSIIANGAKAIDFSNSAALTIGAIADAALSTITATGAGSLNLGALAGIASLTTINASGAAGGVTVAINDAVTSFSGGSGNDFLTIGSNTLGTGVTESGGGGTNTLNVTYAAGALDNPIGSTAGITGFSQLMVSGAATSAGGSEAYDASGFSGLIVNAPVGDILFTNAGAGASLSIIAQTPSTITYQLHKDTANDTLPITVGVDGPAGTNGLNLSGADDIIASRIENITVASKGTLVPGTQNTVQIQDGFASSLVVSGDEKVSLILFSDAAVPVLQVSAASNVTSVNASTATGAVNLSGFATSAAGATIVGGSGKLTASGALISTTATSNVNPDFASTAQKDTVTIGSSSGVAGDVVAVTVNGTTYQYTTAKADTVTTIASGLAAKITAPGFTVGHAAGAVTILDQTAGVLFQSSITVSSKSGLTTASDATSTAFVNGNLNKAVDSISTGSGGGTITIGTGGGWNSFNPPTVPAYDSGSESINLTASAAVTDTLVVGDGAIATNNGAKGGVTGFAVTPSIASADQFFFNSANKTVLANSANPTSVTATDVKNETGALLPSSNLTNLTWTSSNGVITFGATGGHSVNEFTSGQLVAAAEIIVDESTGKQATSVNQVAAFVAGGNTYVVSSGGINNLNNISATTNDNAVVELLGVSGITGFGVTAGQGTITDTAFGNLILQNAGNLGKVTGGTFNDAGFAADTLTTGGAGVTNTFNNLAPSAQMTINGGGTDLGNLVTTQTGAAGANVMEFFFQAANDKLDSATITGDNALIVIAAGDTITALVDPGNTLAVVAVAGALTLGSVTDSALVAISGATDNANVTIGNAVALSQAGLAVTLGNGNDTVIVTGAADHVTLGSGFNHITATGSTSVITVGIPGVATNNGDTITANGAGDTINLGETGFNAVTATGGGTTISEQAVGAVISGGHNQFNVGPNSIIHLTSTNGTDAINVHGDVAGTPSAFSFTTVSGVFHGDTLFFNNTNNENWLGGAGSSAEINVAGVTTLTAAINLAASEGAAANGGVLNGLTGVYDWFQFQGNTYIVEAVNNTGGFAIHPALAAGDEVVELVGLFAPANVGGNHTITL